MSVAGELEDATAITALKDTITRDDAPNGHSTDSQDIETIALDTAKTTEDTPDPTIPADVTKTTSDIPIDDEAVDAPTDGLHTKDSTATLVEATTSSVVNEVIKDTKADDLQDETPATIDTVDIKEHINVKETEEPVTAEPIAAADSLTDVAPTTDVADTTPAAGVADIATTEPQVDVTSPGAPADKEVAVDADASVNADETPEAEAEVPVPPADAPVDAPGVSSAITETPEAIEPAEEAKPSDASVAPVEESTPVPSETNAVEPETVTAGPLQATPVPKTEDAPRIQGLEGLIMLSSRNDETCWVAPEVGDEIAADAAAPVPVAELAATDATAAVKEDALITEPALAHEGSIPIAEVVELKIADAIVEEELSAVVQEQEILETQDNTEGAAAEAAVPEEVETVVEVAAAPQDESPSAAIEESVRVADPAPAAEPAPVAEPDHGVEPEPVVVAEVSTIETETVASEPEIATVDKPAKEAEAPIVEVVEEASKPAAEDKSENLPALENVEDISEHVVADNAAEITEVPAVAEESRDVADEVKIEEKVEEQVAAEAEVDKPAADAEVTAETTDTPQATEPVDSEPATEPTDPEPTATLVAHELAPDVTFEEPATADSVPETSAAEESVPAVETAASEPSDVPALAEEPAVELVALTEALAQEHVSAEPATPEPINVPAAEPEDVAHDEVAPVEVEVESVAGVVEEAAAPAEAPEAITEPEVVATPAEAPTVVEIAAISVIDKDPGVAVTAAGVEDTPAVVEPVVIEDVATAPVAIHEPEATPASVSEPEVGPSADEVPAVEEAVTVEPVAVAVVETPVDVAEAVAAEAIEPVEAATEDAGVVRAATQQAEDIPPPEAEVVSAEIKTEDAISEVPASEESAPSTEAQPINEVDAEDADVNESQPEESIVSDQEVKVEWISVLESNEDSEPVAAEGTPDIQITPDASDSTTDVTAAQEVDRPKSPWTPSYSVTTQGAGVSDDAKELDELEKLPEAEPVTVSNETPAEEAATPQAEASEAEAVPVEDVKVVVEQDEAEPSAAQDTKPSSWPISYSVSSQGASPLHAPQATDDTEVAVIEPLSQPTEVESPPAQDPAAPAPPTPSLPDSTSDITSSAVDQASEPLAVSNVDDIADASITATQFLADSDIAVTSQDSAAEQDVTPAVPEVIADAVEVNDKITADGVLPSEDNATDAKEEEELPVPELQVEGDAADLADEASTAPETIERPWTPSYSVTRQGSSPLQTPQELDETEVPEVPVERPWTPSYSVTRQGTSPLQTPQRLEDELISNIAPKSEAAVVVDEPEALEETTATASEVITEEPQHEAVDTPTVVVADSEPDAGVSETSAESTTANTDNIGRPKSPWAASYTVTQQGSSPLGTPAVQTQELSEQEQPIVEISDIAPQTEVATTVDESETLEEASAPAPKVVIEEAQHETTNTPTVIVADNEPDTAASEPSPEPAIASTNNIERPKSPWAASYTVTQQGSSPLGTPAVQVQELPEQEPKTTTTVADEQQVLETFIPNGKVLELEEAIEVVEPAPVQPTINVDGEVEESSESNNLGKAEDKVERPWTPSYSVTRQGSGSRAPSVNELEPAEANGEAASTEASGEISLPNNIVISPADEDANSAVTGEPRPFPITEVAENGPRISSKPSLARLAPVSENEQVDVTSPADLETLSPTAARTRLESTTSSRYFPGGWFSGPPKTPDETRTSLDHASGVFTKNAGGDASPAIEAPTNTPIDPPHDKRSKSKWCVIM